MEIKFEFDRPPSIFGRPGSLAARLEEKMTGLMTALRQKIDAGLSGGKVQVRTGALRGSLSDATVENDGSIVTGELHMGGVPYTLPLELGSAARVIRAVNKETLRFYLQEQGVAQFRRQVLHPPIKSREFFQQPINEMLDEYRKAFFEAFDETIEEELFR